MKTYSNICKKIIFLVLFILLLMMVLGNLTQKSDKLYSILGYKNYVVLTGSMEPSIYPGDFIIIKRINVNSLKVGDIVTYQKDNITITHRIIQINKNNLITKGDNNNALDSPITVDKVIGKILFIIPKIGYLFNVFSSPLGISIIAGIATVIILYALVYKKI